MIDRRKYIKDTYLRGINKYKHYFFEDKKNKCYISIKKILELDEPFFTRKGLCLINQNYYIVEIVPLHENYCIRVFVNDKKEIILYYFDITLQNGFDSLYDSLYYDDLYLDVAQINPTKEKPYYTLITLGMGKHHHKNVHTRIGFRK